MGWLRGSFVLSFAHLAFCVGAVDQSIFTKASNDSLQWGPYRPNLYFGVRSRHPQSLTTGLLWSRVEDYSSVPKTIRHTCEQHPGLDGYGWERYDPRVGGVQVVRDKENGVDMEVSFAKFDEGHNWGARVRGSVRKDAQVGSALKTSVWLSVGVGGLGGLQVRDAKGGAEKGFENDVDFDGQSIVHGDFHLAVVESDSKNSHPVHAHPSYQSKPLDRTFVYSAQVPAEAMWQDKRVTFSAIKPTLDEYVEKYTSEKLPPPYQAYTIKNAPGSGNMHIVQKVFEGDFEFDIFYTPASATRPSSQDLSERIGEVLKGFDEKYRNQLAPQAPFTSKEHFQFGKVMLSNLVGGIGYFSGDQMIDRSYAMEYDEDNEGFWEQTAEARARNAQKLEGPYELFTTVPSRPFFPRGFLWDEGFHLLPIVDWDPELVMQILSSWFNTMDDDGWIPREQILGPEAREKVPAEFQVQYPHYANPPTLFMTLEALMDKLGDGVHPGATTGGQHPDNTTMATPETLQLWLRQLYPLIEKHFDWYRKTQSGDLKSFDRPEPLFSTREAYRWRGRTPTHILTSGLDDYPRAQPPHPGELHVDLMAWMGMMARSMQRIADVLSEPDDAAHYAHIHEAIRRNTDDLHWDADAQAYCDVTVDAFEESVHVCHLGYVSLTPFLTGLLGPHHAHLGAVLDLLASEEHLWSPHGIRSLSPRDALYGTDENYWRSPVWININYLVLRSLHAVATSVPAGPHAARARRLYTSLRRNLVGTVFESWKATGFAWEQYDPETGEGKRTRHFTGWTSLVVKMMQMPDLPEGSRHDEL